MDYKILKKFNELIVKTTSGLKQLLNALRTTYSYISPFRRQRMLDLAYQRDKTEGIFGKLARDGQSLFQGNVLIDGVFDNPNFWYRLSLVRAALGLAHATEVGVTGQYRARICKRSFRKIGIKRVIRMGDFFPSYSTVQCEARRLLKKTTCVQDVLNWDLPFGFPATQAYDALLKWQRRATLNISDPRLESYLTRCLQNLYAADAILEVLEINLVLVSQPINFDQGGLAWCASIRGIPSIVVTGHCGLTRLRKCYSSERVFSGGDRPSVEDMERLSLAQLNALQDIGAKYLMYRVNGQTNELGAVYAYQRRTESMDREKLTKMFGWSLEKPIVVVYAANWFDYPHAHGMKNFQDFHDWILVTLEIAIRITSVNWLFKAHPCDDWYGGETLTDILPPELPRHIGIIPKTINSRDIIDSVDAMVTVHGTAALEFTHLLKPVLVADKGWYHDIKFTIYSESRDDYLRLLATQWWLNLNIDEVRSRCHIFAGMLYCCPEWQGGLICGDDTEQWSLYVELDHMLVNNEAQVKQEIATIRDWYLDSQEGYHTYKMMQVSQYALSNM